MGKARYIYFNDEIDEKLQTVKNRSALICELLVKHFKSTDYLQMNAKELRLEIEKRKLKADYNTKMEELNNG